jgi:hypothetical protein
MYVNQPKGVKPKMGGEEQIKKRWKSVRNVKAKERRKKRA